MVACGDLLVVMMVVTVMLWWSGHIPDASTILAGGAASGIGFTLVTWMLRGYAPGRVLAGRAELRLTLRAGWIWASGLIGLLYFTRLEVSTPFVVGGITAGVGMVLLVRTGQRAAVRRARAQGQWQRRTLLVGDSEHLRDLGEMFRAEPRHGFDVVGVCAPDGAPVGTGAPVLGDVARAAELIAEHGVRVVVVAASCMGARELRRFCWEVERHGVELLIAPNMEDVSSSRLAVRQVSGTPLLAVAVGPSWWQRTAKIVVDRTLGTLLLLAALPVLGAAALLVKATSAGPAFYRQQRMGRGSAPFTMIKLRTMYIDADRRRAELMQRSDGNEVMFKMRDDPRITPVGRVLRRFSVDELPQLWNVVRGDMSLVGPRPPLPEEVADYDPDAKQRLRVKPGLTGLWQVSGRSDLDWDQTVRLDLSYVDNRSFGLDLSILGRTFGAVFGGRGAY